MENPQVTVLVILLLFILFTPDQPRFPYHSQNESERLNIEKSQDFDALANSTYGQLTTSGLNLTGVRLEDGYQINLILEAQALSRRQREENWVGFDALAPVYHDIDGELLGTFERINVTLEEERKINLTEVDPNAEYFSHVYERNITEAQGKLNIVLEDIERTPPYMPREARAVVAIHTDSSPGNGWDINMRGVHFPTGLVVLTTSSRKFNALPALPHFTLSSEDFTRATPVMNTSLTKIWNHIDPADELTLIAAPKCELIAWLQPKPLIGSKMYIKEIEDELNNPDGAPVGDLPPLVYSAILFSPDCGYMLKADTLYGPKKEAYSALVQRLCIAFCMIMVLQIVLLKRQMEKCATPSTRSRISYRTIGIAAFSDGLILTSIIGLLIADTTVFLLAGVAAFLCAVHVAFLEVKFIFDIWTVQVGDPINAERERQRRTAANATNTANAATSTEPPATTSDPTSAPPGTVSLPAPAPAPSPATAPPPPPTPPTSEAGLPLPATARTNQDQPIVLPSDQDTTTITPRASFSSLYTKFYFALMNLTFFTLWASSWSTPYRRGYFTLLIFCFFSLWLPQIHRNTMRNCRKALNWEYVLGTSALRAIPMLYWYVADRNLLNVSPSPRTATVLLCWLGLQILALLSQQFFGARWFVKDAWCPPAYDYHPILYDDLEAGGLPIGEVTSASEGKDRDAGAGAGGETGVSMFKDKPQLAQLGGTVKTRKIFDCAICMNEIDVPVVSKDEKGAAWLEQRNYMVTPCRHIFHSECLEGWMNLRLVCPVCREGLPPL